MSFYPISISNMAKSGDRNSTKYTLITALSLAAVCSAGVLPRVATAGPLPANTILTYTTESGRQLEINYAHSAQAIQLKVAGGAAKTNVDILSKLGTVDFEDDEGLVSIYFFEKAGNRYRFTIDSYDDGTLEAGLFTRSNGGAWAVDGCKTIDGNADFQTTPGMPPTYDDPAEFYQKNGDGWRLK